MKAFSASSDAQGAGAPVAKTGRVARGPFDFLPDDDRSKKSAS
jgi:hypothetical protein